MIKKLLLSSLFAGSYLFSFGQGPTLTAINYSPQIWNTFSSVLCDTTGVTPGAAGAGVIWDFSSSLIPNSLPVNASDYPCSATPGCSHFPGSSLAVRIPVTTAMAYYIESASALSQDGYYESSDTFATYSNPMDQLRYPMSYLTSYSDPYSGIVVLGPLSAHENGNLVVNADGYGTLKLPGVPSAVTYSNVLRVHSTQTFGDSLSLFGTPFVATFSIETYTWYMPNYHSPLLTILTSRETDGIGTLYEKAVAFTAGAVNVLTPTVNNSIVAFETFPNPAKDQLNIRYTTPTSEHVVITLMDVIGRQLATIADGDTQGEQVATLNTSAFARGIYMVRFQSGSQSMTKKIELQ